ncbi:MAG: aa3-type cytochrome c oxidase subunit IV [Rhodospirillales bacterium]|tara:strand:- start:2328 stop:2630 length:303 start_codon:yes stop_codon:yes gene_type:complete
MATSEYHHGEMDIQAQQSTWNGFITGGLWGGMLTVLSVGYAVLAVAIGMNWMISLGLMAIVGFGVGLFLNMGGRWMATMVLLILLALVVQGFIWMFGVLL